MYRSKIELHNVDCLPFMKQCEDKQFDLAIVDPPYGIGAGSNKFINGNRKHKKDFHRENDWDNERPSKEYFDELKRISKNQIVWGGNYFADLLGAFRCFIFWDKTIHGNSYADGEMAWASFDTVARYYRKNISQITSEGRIHPTQKPETLYEYILTTFAEPNQKIFDSHLGSGSIAIACDKLGFDLTACEIDKQYFDRANKKIDQHRRQQTLF